MRVRLQIIGGRHTEITLESTTERRLFFITATQGDGTHSERRIGHHQVARLLHTDAEDVVLRSLARQFTDTATQLGGTQTEFRSEGIDTDTARLHLLVHDIDNLQLD